LEAAGWVHDNEYAHSGDLTEPKTPDAGSDGMSNVDGAPGGKCRIYLANYNYQRVSTQRTVDMAGYSLATGSH